jgi:hypothetical protein
VEGAVVPWVVYSKKCNSNNGKKVIENNKYDAYKADRGATSEY